MTNPCNTNCLIARTTAHDVPSDHWFALTRLDQNRARAMLAHKANVSVDQVTRVTVWGNHGPSVFADFHNAWIGDRPAHQVIHDRDWVRIVFEPGVAGRGRVLYNATGVSPAASTAQAIIGSVRSLTTPTPLGHWFSAAVVSDGSYGNSTWSRLQLPAPYRRRPYLVDCPEPTTLMATESAGSPRTSPSSNWRRWPSQTS